MGVRRAVDLAVDKSNLPGKKILTLGPLIHNTQTVEMLKERGVEVLDEDRPPSPDAHILIRAHGIPPDKEHFYTQRGHTIIDGTCPKVKTVHRVIEKYRDQGFHIIIAGDEGHAEVVALQGYAGTAGHLIQSPADVDALPLFDKVCLVSQTTFDRRTFDEIADRIKSKYLNARVAVKKTICSATDRRQEETRELAKRVDAMIVVGSKHSANTLRLARISAKYAPHTQHVETENEIDWEPLVGCKTVGITAGASTPHWMIRRVRDHINFLARKNRKGISNVFWQVINVMAHLNIFVACGAVALYYASCYMQGFPFTETGAVLAFLYILSMYLWNSLTSIDLTQHLGMSRYRFYNAHKRGLFVLVIFSVCFLLGISYVRSIELFYLMLIPTIAGTVYHFTIVPKSLRRYFTYSNLQDIPTSRDLFVALAWSVLITLIPHAILPRFALTPTTLLFFFWTFYLAYMRSLIFDLKDIEGDRIMGRETLVTVIGEIRVRKTMHVALWVAGIGLVCFSALSLTTDYPWPDTHTGTFLFQIPVIVYLWLFMQWNQKITSSHESLFNIFADGQFFIAGLGAWVACAAGF